MTETCIKALYNESAKQINGRRNVSAFIHNTVFSIYSYNCYTALNTFYVTPPKKGEKMIALPFEKLETDDKEKILKFINCQKRKLC